MEEFVFGIPDKHTGSATLPVPINDVHVPSLEVKKSKPLMTLPQKFPSGEIYSP
jgi:hypothetical protein